MNKTTTVTTPEESDVAEITMTAQELHVLSELDR